MVGYFGGMTFGGDENEVGERALEISKRRAVNVMNDDGHARTSGREASEKSGLAAVGVDEIRPLFAQNFFKFAEGDEIFQRVNGADEFGNDGEILTAGLSGVRRLN